MFNGVLYAVFVFVHTYMRVERTYNAIIYCICYNLVFCVTCYIGFV